MASTEPLVSLTETQEQDVRTWLDDALRQLERDQRKRRLGPLSTLVGRLRVVMVHILQLPPYEPWASTRVAYLLSFTGSMVDYITALPLMTVPADADETDPNECANLEEEAGDIMRSVLDLIAATDAAWITVLRGEGWVAEPEPHSVPVPDGASVDQTARVRLQSIVEIGREKMLAWARPYGDFGGEIMGPDGDEGEEVTQDEKTGWEGEVLRMWRGIQDELQRQAVAEGRTDI